jgi:hypothetical protein
MSAQRRSVSFKVKRAEQQIILILARRACLAAKKLLVDYPLVDAEMDITACHANGCRLDLAALAAADDSDFNHDVFGIRRHIDRSTGELMDCFVPRFISRTSVQS